MAVGAHDFQIFWSVIVVVSVDVMNLKKIKFCDSASGATSIQKQILEMCCSALEVLNLPVTKIVAFTGTPSTSSNYSAFTSRDSGRTHLTRDCDFTLVPSTPPRTTLLMLAHAGEWIAACHARLMINRASVIYPFRPQTKGLNNGGGNGGDACEAGSVQGLVDGVT